MNDTDDGLFVKSIILLFINEPGPIISFDVLKLLTPVV